MDPIELNPWTVVDREVAGQTNPAPCLSTLFIETFVKDRMQRLRSWGELRGFWQGFLKNSFTQREATLDNLAIQASGDVAWVVFDWEFSGTQTDGK